MSVAHPAPASDPARRLARLLPGREDLEAGVRHVHAEAEKVFRDGSFEAWFAACRHLAECHLGTDTTFAYMRSSTTCARAAGIDAALALERAAVTVGQLAGAGAAREFLDHAVEIARLLGNAEQYRRWLDLIADLAGAAPESVGLVAGESRRLLRFVGVDGLSAWVLDGLRAAGASPEGRRRFFALATPLSRGLLHEEAGDLPLVSVERRLRAYVQALFGVTLSLRHHTPEEGPDGTGGRKRVAFDGSTVHVPAYVPGLRGEEAIHVYRAALAHVAAHLTWSGERFTVGRLKPLQVALVSLIEDARVENLAMRRYPGLHDLWLPLHKATRDDGLSSSVLLARLSRALIDPEYIDGNPWVEKGRRLFFEARSEWEDPAFARRIGGLLGNDLGQMRVQFNARTYQVQPTYRDDNSGLWDLPEPEGRPEDDPNAMVEGARPEKQEQEDADAADDVLDEADAGADGRDISVQPNIEMRDGDGAGDGITLHAEWDYEAERYRPDWVTVIESRPHMGSPDLVDRILQDNPGVARRTQALIRMARISRPTRMKRQPDGEQLDLDACLDAAISSRIGLTPDPRVYITTARRHRDLSVLLLLDVSQSTADKVPGTGGTVLDMEMSAAAVMADAMAGLGDRFAIQAFCSSGRHEANIYRVKDFQEPFGPVARSRLAGLSSGLSTRMGAFIRHGARSLANQATLRRLLLVVTDGEPSDVDTPDRRYFAEDARKAVQALAGRGIDVLGIGLGGGDDQYLRTIFGRRGYIIVPKLNALPHRLLSVYLRLAK